MPESTSPTSKECTGCTLTKQLDDFPPHKRGRLGRDSKCRECHRAKAREAYAADPELGRKRAKEWRDNNPDYGKGWALENYERRKPHYWRSSYRQRMTGYGHEPSVVDDFTMADIVELYGDECWHCKDAPFEHLDHYPIPVAKAGPHSLTNVKPSCASCNFARSAEMRDMPTPTPTA